MTITRGKLQRGDHAQYDGKTIAATRTDASGGTITGLALNDYVDVLQVFGGGTARTLATIEAAKRGIGSSVAKLVFAPGTWTITDDITLPSNLTCEIPAGCVFSVSASKTLTFQGRVNVEYLASWSSGSGSVVREQTLTGAGAVDILTDITWLVTTGADALTLADGAEGQKKIIIMKTDGGDGTLTPSNYAGGTTIVFSAVGDAAELLFTNSAWHLIGSAGSKVTTADLASTANAKGASLVGIEDSGSIITATTVEAALAEIKALVDANVLDVGVTKVKSADQNVANSTTLVDDDHLVGWSLTAGKYYSFEALLAVSQDGGNLKYMFTFTNAPTSEYQLLVATDSNSVEFRDSVENVGQGTRSILTMTDGLIFALRLNGFFQANGSTGGTVKFQWAQQTSDADNTTIKEGSWVRITQLD